MKHKKYILLVLSVMAVLIALGYQIGHQASTKWTIYDSLHAKIWYGVAIAIAIPVTWFSIKHFRRTKNRTCLLPCLIIGTGIIIIATNTLRVNLKEESPSILTAEHDGSVHWIALNLKADGTYHMNNHNSYKGGEYYDGTYTMVNDTITLDKCISLGGGGGGALCMSQKWVIRHDSIFFDLFFPGWEEEVRDTGYFIIKERINQDIYTQVSETKPQITKDSCYTEFCRVNGKIIPQKGRSVDCESDAYFIEKILDAVPYHNTQLAYCCRFSILTTNVKSIIDTGECLQWFVYELTLENPDNRMKAYLNTLEQKGSERVEPITKAPHVFYLFPSNGKLFLVGYYGMQPYYEAFEPNTFFPEIKRAEKTE